MPMDLVDVKVVSYEKTFNYNLYHYTDGPVGTCLSFPLEMKTNDGTLEQKRVNIAIKIDDCSGSTPDEALDKMTSWLRRLAEGIESRKSMKIPI